MTFFTLVISALQTFMLNPANSPGNMRYYISLLEDCGNDTSALIDRALKCFGGMRTNVHKVLITQNFH